MSNLTPYNKRNNNMDKKTKDIFDVEGFFESLISDAFFPNFCGCGNIKADIMENEKEYILEAELPGISKEEIHIDIRDDKLTISVQRSEETNEERENYIKRERRSGSLSRVFYLSNIKEEGVKAKYSNGILTINLPKRDETVVKNSRIQIE
jgi:HSP20 family protein